MARKAMETLTESMFYILMALSKKPMCGIDIADAVDHLTCNRLLLGPATLYTILGKFEKEGYIKEIEVVGRKRTYEITSTGVEAYKNELARLQQCIADALKWESGC